MTKQTIEVEGLPEGWKAVAYRKPLRGEYVFNNGIIKIAPDGMIGCWLIVEKIHPSRIVLEETGETRSAWNEEWYRHHGAFKQHNGEPTMDKYQIWREVKEPDIPLNNDETSLKIGVSQRCGEPTLELSVKEVRNVRSLIKDFENLGWFINPERALLLQKITEFIKDK